MGNTPSTTDFNPYEILGVERDADLEEIKLAYKLKAKQLHPDRNRGKPDFEHKRDRFKLVQIAFDILSSNENRRQYDNQYGSTHVQMRDESRKAIGQAQQQEQPKAERKKFVPQGKFDNDAFNKAFQERRFADPNDRGYGEEMAPRLNPKDIRGDGQRNDDLDKPEMLFRSREAFNPEDFNKIFEYHKEQHQKQNPIIAQDDIEPAGFSLESQTPYTDIAVYEGAMILGRETNDFSGATAGSGTGNDGLLFSDYKQTFVRNAQNPGALSKNLLNDIRGRSYKGDVGAMSDSEFQKRLNDKQMAYRAQLVPEIPSGQRKASFAMAEQLYVKQKEEELRKEREEHKNIVMKYKDQYPQHLLDDLGISAATASTNTTTTNTVSDDPRTNRSINDLMRERNAIDQTTNWNQQRRRRPPF
jgi:curved DNA-binding protein CbpA